MLIKCLNTVLYRVFQGWLNKINDLRYDGLKQAYLRQIEDISYNKLSFEERLYNLLESQEIFLHNNIWKNRVKFSTIICNKNWCKKCKVNRINFIEKTVLSCC